MATPVLFDRELRRRRRERGWRSQEAPFLHDLAFAELVSRLGDVRRRFGDTMLVGCSSADWPAQLAQVAGPVTVTDASPLVAAACGGIAADEDRLPLADASFDLIVAIGSLDGIDDLPGALLLLRRILRPDGLMLAALGAAGSLPRLRSAMLAADATLGGAAARMHPAIDVRTGGDLLARAGFALPVADTHGVDLSYTGLPRLVRDLRAHGATNILDRRSRVPLGRAALAAAASDFAEGAVDGRTTERVEILYLSGWAPAPSQPRPARQGSATTYLAEALPSRSEKRLQQPE